MNTSWINWAKANRNNNLPSYNKLTDDYMVGSYTDLVRCEDYKYRSMEGGTNYDFIHRMVVDIEESIMEHYDDIVRSERLKYNLNLEETVTKYIEDYHMDIFTHHNDWVTLDPRRGYGDSPVEGMTELIQMQKFIMTQYDPVKLISDPDSPYWNYNPNAQFFLCIYSKCFIHTLLRRLAPQLSIYDGGINESIDDLRGGEINFSICAEDLETLEAGMEGVKGDKVWAKIQALIRGRNTRWRVPLHLLTIS